MEFISGFKLEEGGENKSRRENEPVQKERRYSYEDPDRDIIIFDMIQYLMMLIL